MAHYQWFDGDKLTNLREELLSSGLDSWQAGELLEAFMSEHGYGVSKDDAKTAASRIGSAGFTIVQVRAELEKLALVM